MAMKRNLAQWLNRVGIGLLLSAFLTHVSADQANAQGAGNPEILDAIQKLQTAVNNLQTTVNGIVSGGVAAKPREYYLTKGTFQGNQILSPPAATPACAPGFHFASLWEIFDTSNLKYATSLGLTQDDSGSGPPTILGWVRTGFSKETSAMAGQANCNAWTSNASSANGTIAELGPGWTLVASGFPFSLSLSVLGPETL